MTKHERCPACGESGVTLQVHGDRGSGVACMNDECRVYLFKRYFEVGT